jgi:hypothetical protein
MLTLVYASQPSVLAWEDNAMKNVLKDRNNRYLFELAVLGLVFIAYIAIGEFLNISWLPSTTNFPLTDLMINKAIFFVIIVVSTARFQVKGGIVATVIGLIVMIWRRSFDSSTLDVVTQLMISAMLGVAVAFFLGNFLVAQDKLKKALGQVKTLSGLIPICASCKSIRNDKGYFESVEHYIKEHSSVDFTHTLCEECVKKLYPDVDLTPKS